MTHSVAWQAAELAAREAYGRLLAWLSAQWRDLDAAEDALADALLAALQQWPTEGVPDAPEAWLLTAARRRLQQGHRHSEVVTRHRQLALDSVGHPGDPNATSANGADELPDYRLRLLLICAHPSIDGPMRIALMLQVVLGLEAAQMASAFLLSPAALAQRLVRAKRKLRAENDSFEEPEPHDVLSRLPTVLEAIYGAYGLGWDDGEASAVGELRREALYLAGLLAALLPAQAEAAGLLSLLELLESRQAARMDTDGEFVPLLDQDTTRWNLPLIQQAESRLWRAAARRTPGPYQLEAAIQSAHCQRIRGGPVPWAAIATLYGHLLQLAPTRGAEVGCAVALAESGQRVAAAALLDALPEAQRRNFLPYWVARARLAELNADTATARDSLQRAIGLCAYPPQRRYLLRRLAGF